MPPSRYKNRLQMQAVFYLDREIGINIVFEMKKLVVFDLDGTLLDTIGDLAAACDYVLKGHHLPTHTQDEYHSYVGNGVKKLIERTLPLDKRDENFIEELRREFIEYYHSHIDVHTTPYNGINDLLGKLCAMGVKIAVLSNKYHDGTVKLISTFFPHIAFVDVRGQMENIPIKPSPDALFSIMEYCGAKREETLYVGDTAVDIHTAHNAGVDVVAVSWGFRKTEDLAKEKPTYIVNHPIEILDYL